ncbi:DDE family transposase [Paraburkholderia sp. BL23I1N1]|uniref:IS5 family transposase n=1 Tax=Paraburkholderia sp. BL23I1N1 TaxID=1938802 RepID=UPI000E73F002|nr:IS5 family transposase [Paraburkholderia sp. BL23I1N1]RKE39656.1 DDE family transposase [Paraburkholderia sp. BL23I1N1]
MRKDERKASEPKGVYRVRNWREYNTGLISRGDVTMWIDESVLVPVSEAGPARRGRPRVYSDAVIQMLLGLKQVFHLPLRALQGFALSLHKLAYPGLPVPNYSTLSRRAQTLKVVLPTQRPDAPLHLVIDSTGLKVYGEGEWKVRKHGYSKRRTWRKVHLAMDANTGQICAALMTHQDEGDGEVLPDLLDQIPADVVIDTIGGDGAYDTRPCHAQIAARSAIPSIPPREGAKPWPDSTPGAAWRNAAIDAIGRSSRREWKLATGYHRRSLAETLMYRLKVLTGPCLWARETGSQATEVSIRAGVLNRMTALARPQSVRIA